MKKQFGTSISCMTAHEIDLSQYPNLKLQISEETMREIEVIEAFARRSAFQARFVMLD